ncbi:hypothetical protein LCGC14_1916350 [marine sediment metagenome]|uniref:Uncharacterized protein n=1 Tax=marine sediment metagenome TaxID=412755 RepID=A0A0F9GFI0_9ZZZZ
MLTESFQVIPTPSSPQRQLVHDRRGRQGSSLSLPLEVTVEADYITLLHLSPQSRPSHINTIGTTNTERLDTSNMIERKEERISKFTVHTAGGSHVPAQGPAFHGSPFSTPLIVSIPKVVFP